MILHEVMLRRSGIMFSKLHDTINWILWPRKDVLDNVLVHFLVLCVDGTYCVYSVPYCCFKQSRFTSVF